MNTEGGVPDDDGLIEELPDDGADPLDSARHRRWRSIVTAATVVLATIGVVAVAGLWPGKGPDAVSQATTSRSTSGEPTPPTSASSPGASATASVTTAPTLAGTPTEQPTPRPAPVPLTVAAGWRAQTFGADPGGDEHDVVSTFGTVGGMQIAVGDQEGEGIVLGWARKFDGSWRELWSFRVSPSGAPDLLPAGIDQVNGTLVVAGTRYAIDVAFPEIWYREANQAWAKTTITSECGSLTGMTRTPRGLLAFGSTCGQLPGGPPASTEMLLYTSADGAHWTRRSIALPGSAVPADLLWDGSRLVGVGYADGGSAVSLTSDDGSHWTTRPLPGIGSYRSAQHLIQTSTGYLAVGLDGTEANALQPPPVVWSSPDAITWKVVFRGQTGQWVTGLTETANGLSMLGMHPGDTGSPDLLLWTSPDGERWSEAQVIASGGHFLPVDVLTVGDSIVVVTNRDSGTAAFPENQPLALTRSLPVP